MNFKQFSTGDLSELRISSDVLRSVPGVSDVVTTPDKSWLGMHGQAHVMIGINAEIADLIWGVMGMSKTGEQSAYNDVMASKKLEFDCPVFKFGGIFSTLFYMNAAIHFEPNLRVELGSCAAKNIPFLIDKLREILIAQEKLEGSTEEAISKV